jgi:hypothetical protein
MLQLLPLRFLSALLASSIAVLTTAQIVAFAAGASVPQEPLVNPLVGFAHLMPGQPFENAQRLQCGYNPVIAPASSDTFGCWDPAENLGYIDGIGIAFHDGIIEQTTFIVRLRYGDLMMWFGQPDRRSLVGRTSYFRWERLTAGGMQHQVKPLSLYTPVRYVTFLESEDVEAS